MSRVNIFQCHRTLPHHQSVEKQQLAVVFAERHCSAVEELQQANKHTPLKQAVGTEEIRTNVPSVSQGGHQLWSLKDMLDPCTSPRVIS